MTSDIKIIGTPYQYTYGAGNNPNRRLTFTCNDESGKKISALVEGKLNGIWKEIGTIDEDSMILGGGSTTEKMNITLAARENDTEPVYPKDRLFNELEFQEKENVIKELQPEGVYHISVISGIGDDPLFEKIKKLSFFDPS